MELNQAKKRDNKKYITDVAIDKVSLVQVEAVSDDFSNEILEMHKSILRISQKDNNSDEVLCLYSVTQNGAVYVKGDTFHVDPSNNQEAYGMFVRAHRNDLWYLHNHPSTNKFSMADIQTFVRYSQIGGMSVVTNQGEIYIIYKTEKYDYNKIARIFTDSVMSYKQENSTHDDAVNMFLKKCAKGGVCYARG